MANRHEVQKKKGGGGVKPKHDPDKKAYTGAGSHVAKEAEEEKRGGKVCKATGGAVKPRLDKRARGGGVNKSGGGDMKSSPWSGAHVKGIVSAGNPPLHRGK
jgi:hypothetical protein